MESIELQPVSLCRDPPPAYEETDPIQPRRGARNRRDGRGVWRTGVAILGRQTCSDPCSPAWPGCCKVCAATLFLDSVVLSAQMTLGIVAGSLLSKGPGWKQTPAITCVLSMVVFCVRTSSQVSEVLGAIGRASQAISLLAAAIASEMSPEGQRPFDTVLPTQSVQPASVVTIACLSLSVVCCGLNMGRTCDCLWAGPDWMWMMTILTALTGCTLGMLGVLCSPQWTIPQGLALAATLSLVAVARDCTFTVSNTCVYKANRYISVGSLAPIGRARCPLRGADGRRLVEDEVSCAKTAWPALVEITASVLISLSVPVMFFVFYVRTGGTRNTTYAAVSAAASVSTLCGTCAAFAFAPEPHPEHRAFTGARISTGVVFVIGILLLACLQEAGLVVYAIGAAMAATVTTSAVRACGRRGVMLSTSCFGKAVLASQIVACTMSSPMAWVAYNYVLKTEGDMAT